MKLKIASVTILLKNKPEITSNSFVQVHVIKENEHVHTILKSQLRGEERREAVNDCWINKI